MDLIELTLRHYRRLAPPADLAPTAQVSDALESWLSGNVCLLAEELFELEKFQELANWTVSAFDYDVDTPQRTLVRAVDSALVGLAGALVRLADRPSVAQSLVKLEATWPNFAEPCLEGESVAVGATPSIAAVATIARRPWLDLAAPEEYFHPSRQLYTIASEPRLDQFDPFASSELPRLGDFVTRSMFLRIDYWRAHLGRLYQQCVVALTLWGDANLLEEALGARTALDSSLQQLTATCLSGPMFQLRECAIALVQVYNAYAAAPRLAWLSIPSDLVQANRGLTRLSIRRDGVCDMAAIELVACAIMSLTPLYREADFGQSKLAKAVAAKRLVLTDSPRSAYWESRRVDANWERKSMLWELLWELASQARLGLPVDRNNLSNKNSLRAIRDRRSDLGALLPADLNNLIVNAGRFTYRLDLPPDAISLFEHEDDELTETGRRSLDSELLASARRPSR